MAARQIPPGASAEARAVHELAAALAGRLRVLFTAAAGARPSLTVTASHLPHARGVSVIAREGWFWWPWGERIAPLADVTGAADLVAAQVTARPHG